jgi:hypothetical protein
MMNHDTLFEQRIPGTLSDHPEDLQYTVDSSVSLGGVSILSPSPWRSPRLLFYLDGDTVQAPPATALPPPTPMPTAPLFRPESPDIVPEDALEVELEDEVEVKLESSSSPEIFRSPSLSPAPPARTLSPIARHEQRVRAIYDDLCVQKREHAVTHRTKMAAACQGAGSGKNSVKKCADAVALVASQSRIDYAKILDGTFLRVLLSRERCDREIAVATAGPVVRECTFTFLFKSSFDDLC